MRVHTINRMTKNPNGGYKQQQDEGPYYQQDERKSPNVTTINKIRVNAIVDRMTKRAQMVEFTGKKIMVDIMLNLMKNRGEP